MNRLFLLLFGMVTLVAHAQIPDYVPTEGLVAWYPFNGNANDESGNGYHCESHGAVLTANRYGTPLSAFNFDGEGSHLRGVSLPFSNLSISLWFMHDFGGYTYTSDPNSTPPIGAQLIGQGTEHNPCAFADFAIGFADAPTGNDDLLAWEKSNAAGCSVQQSSAGWPLEVETWIHLIAISEGNQVDFFINGDWVNSVEFDEPFNASGSVLSIGARYVEDCIGGEPCSGPGNAWSGAIDDVAVWNRALTEEEILALYNAPAPVPGCTDPTACNFDAEATSDDGSCIPSGCMELEACNYNALAECEGEACEYTCCPGPGCCSAGMYWDYDLEQCMNYETCQDDLDGDGVIGVNDLMQLLSSFGTDCAPAEEPETTEFTCGDPVSYHGYDYATVQIGEQCWFAENLRTELYSNGDSIPHLIDCDSWSSAPNGAYCHYDNEPDSTNSSGLLYNWFATNFPNGICPSEWHVPSDAEWMTLEMELGMSESEANSTYWRGTDEGSDVKSNLNWNGSNTSGFGAIPGGTRGPYNGCEFAAIEYGTWYWTSTGNGSLAVGRGLTTEESRIVRMTSYQLRNGFSVRCIKD